MNAPTHEPIVRALRRKRILDAGGLVLAAITILSVVGTCVAIKLGNGEAARDFLAALIGSGFTLVLIALYENRDL